MERLPRFVMLSTTLVMLVINQQVQSEAHADEFNWINNTGSENRWSLKSNWGVASSDQKGITALGSGSYSLSGDYNNDGATVNVGSSSLMDLGTIAQPAKIHDLRYLNEGASVKLNNDLTTMFIHKTRWQDANNDGFVDYNQLTQIKMGNLDLGSNTLTIQRDMFQRDEYVSYISSHITGVAGSAAIIIKGDPNNFRSNIVSFDSSSLLNVNLTIENSFVDIGYKFQNGTIVQNGGVVRNCGNVSNGSLVVNDGVFYNKSSAILMMDSAVVTNSTFYNSGIVVTPVVLNGGKFLSGDFESNSNNGGFVISSFTLKKGLYQISEQSLHTGNITINSNYTSRLVPLGSKIESQFEVTPSRLLNEGSLHAAKLTLNGGWFWNKGSVIADIVANAGVCIFDNPVASSTQNSNLTLNNSATVWIKENTALNEVNLGSSATLLLTAYQGSDSRKVSTLQAVKMQVAPGATVKIIPDSDATQMQAGDKFIVAQTVADQNNIHATASSLLTLSEKAVFGYDLELTQEADSQNVVTSTLSATRKRIAYKNLVAPEHVNLAAAIDGYRRKKAQLAQSGETPDYGKFAPVISKLESIELRSDFANAVAQLNGKHFTTAQFSAAQSSQAFSRYLQNYTNQRRLALLSNQSNLNDSLAVGHKLSNESQDSLLDQANLFISPQARHDFREIGYNSKYNVFGRAISGFSNVDSTTRQIGLTGKSVGAVFGFDIRVHENMFVGISGSYNYSDIKFKRDLGSGRVNSYRVGPYATIFKNNWFFEAELKAGIHENSFTRNISFANMKAKSDYYSHDLTASVGAGYDFKIAGINLTPRASIQYQYYHSNSFTEKNADGANLKVHDYETNSLQTKLGLELWKRHKINSTKLKSITSFVNVAWRREWIAPADIKSKFAAGGDSFNVDNNLYSKDSILMGAGVSFEVSKSMSVDLQYQAELGDRSNQSQSASITLRYRF